MDIYEKDVIYRILLEKSNEIHGYPKCDTCGRSHDIQDDCSVFDRRENLPDQMEYIAETLTSEIDQLRERVKQFKTMSDILSRELKQTAEALEESRENELIASTALYMLHHSPELTIRETVWDKIQKCRIRRMAALPDRHLRVALVPAPHEDGRIL
jgi:hypothetical protein